jgi:hypothetical protein
VRIAIDIGALAAYLAGEGAKTLEQEELDSAMPDLAVFAKSDRRAEGRIGRPPRTRPLSSEKAGLPAVFRGALACLVVSCPRPNPGGPDLRRLSNARSGREAGLASHNSGEAKPGYGFRKDFLL